MEKELIGFIGLGIMGRPMTLNIMKAGYPVIVYNRTRKKAEEMASHGAQVASSPKEVAQRTNITIIIVTDSPDVEQVVLGPNGVLEGVHKGSVVIDMSTISPAVTRQLSARLAQKGVQMLDAPVTGGSYGAVQGTLSIMVGGDKETFDRCVPLFETMGKRVVHIGPSGMGQLAKLVNQVIVGGTLASVCEGLLLAAKGGADLQAIMKAITGGAANSWQLETLGPRILKRDFSPGFMIKLMNKDLRLINEMSRQMLLPMPVTAAAQQFYHVTERDGYGEEGTTAYIKTLEKLAEIEVKAPPSP